MAFEPGRKRCKYTIQYNNNNKLPSKGGPVDVTSPLPTEGTQLRLRIYKIRSPHPQAPIQSNFYLFFPSLYI